MTEVRKTNIAVALFGVFLLAWPQLTGPYLTSVGFAVLMWVALTQSWFVLSGMTGYISLGHVVFYGLGGYMLALCWGTLPPWLGVLIGGAAAGLLALLVGYPCLRVRGPYFVMLTLGLAELAKFVVIDIESSLDNFGRLIIRAPPIEVLYYAMFALAALSYALASWVRLSRFGLALRAIREDEAAAGTLGVSATGYKLAAFVLSAIIPGMVGAVVIMRSGYFEPLPAFNPLISLTIIAMVVMGGSDDAPGPLLGAIFFSVLSELLWANFLELYMIIVGVVLIAFVLVVPDGLHGRLRTWLSARPAGESRGGIASG